MFYLKLQLFGEEQNRKKSKAAKFCENKKKTGESKGTTTVGLDLAKFNSLTSFLGHGDMFSSKTSHSKVQTLRRGKIVLIDQEKLRKELAHSDHRLVQ